MSLNPFIHPRNPYKTPPDFKAMAVQDSDFRRVVKTELTGKVSLDFKDREAVRILTQTLLKLDFNLNIDIPPKTLVPTLPLRFNYLLWLEDMMLENEVGGDIVGLDIGVGATCIYPILAVKKFGWKMFGTDIDDTSLSHAQGNVDRNNMGDKIKLFKQDKFDLKQFGTNLIFTMSNPPFFDENKEEEEEQESAGQSHEMKTKGGEVDFVKNIYAASQQVGDSVPLFTCMLGHKSSAKALKKFFFQERDTTQSKLKFLVTEFCQGKTMRWGIAWSFNDHFKLIDHSLIREKQAEKKKHLPVSFVLKQMGPGNPIVSCKVLFQQLHAWFETIDVAVKPGKIEDDKCSFTIKTFQQNWKNQRRKRREEERRKNEQEALLTEPPASKRLKVDEEEMEVTPSSEEEKAIKQHRKDLKGELQICSRFFVTRDDEGNANFEIHFIDGAAGKDGLFQLVQFIKNKSNGL